MKKFFLILLSLLISNVAFCQALKPDFTILANNYKFYNTLTNTEFLANPVNINSNMPNFKIIATIHNLGGPAADSINVKVSRIVPSSTDSIWVVWATKRIPAPVFSDTVSFLLYNDWEDEYDGVNSVFIQIDSNNEKTESNENNNLFGRSVDFHTFKPTGINDLNTFNPTQISYYPNPVSSNLHISQIVPNLDVQIFDIQGHEIFATKTEDTYLNIPFESFNKGIYFVKIISKNTIFTIKIIK